MNNHTKHRIIGILVVIGLVIILLPLFQSKEDLSVKQSAPELKEQLAADEEVVTIPVHDLSQQVDFKNDFKTTSDEVSMASQTPNVTHESLTTQSKIIRKPIVIKENKITQVKKSVKESKIQKKEIKGIVKKSNHTEQLALKPKVIKLENELWLIQVGSYNSLSQAEQIIKKLKDKGQVAYFKEMTTPDNNEKTIVFIGPEIGHQSAITLMRKINKELNLKAIVVKYQTWI